MMHKNMGYFIITTEFEYLFSLDYIFKEKNVSKKKNGE